MCKQSRVHLCQSWVGLALVVAVALAAPMPVLAGETVPSAGEAGYSLYLPVVRSGGESADVVWSRIFPVDLAVASPLHMENVVNAAAVNGSWATGYAIATAEIYSVLTGATAVTTVFDAAGLLMAGVDANCYGPTLQYRNHPDGGGGGTGELPHGDLGIWQEMDSTGDACAAAQINARLNGAEQQSQASLLLMAALIDAATDAGLSLPVTGGVLDVTAAISAAGIPHVTFTLATISYDVTTGTWTYYAEFTYTDPADGSVHPMVVSLDYTPDATRLIRSTPASCTIAPTTTNCGATAQAAAGAAPPSR
jgi:hypothetical protein